MTLLDAILLGSVALLLWLGLRRVSLRAYLRVNPRYRGQLERHGLTSARSLLSLPAVIISGHPDRNVSRVLLGTGSDALPAFLKREHRVRWKQRLANFFDGFGLVSLSHREAIALRQLRRAGIECPNWIAVGADGQGRAFLLVEELAGYVELRRFLADATLSLRERRRLARNIGESVAHLHNAGFVHADLYAKHFLIDPRDFRLSILDWQRSHRRHRVNRRHAWRELAAIDATLDDKIAGPRERLVSLRAYISARLAASRRRARSALRSEDSASRLNEGKKLFAEAVADIREWRAMLLRRRHVREARQVASARQELIWLDNEALCVTPEYYREHGASLPAAMSLSRNQVACESTSLPQGAKVFFVQRRMDRVFAWLASWFGGRPVVAPEVRQAGLLFRLQRYGVRTSRLLAFGQRQVSPWRTESFLLTEPPAGARSLADWLAQSAARLPDAATSRQRRLLLREIGTVLRRLHAAGCYLQDGQREENGAWPRLTVHETDEETPERRVAVTLARVDGLRLHRRPSDICAARDLAEFRMHSDAGHLSRTDEWRVLLAYIGCARLTADGRRFVRQVEAATRARVRP